MTPRVPLFQRCSSPALLVCPVESSETYYPVRAGSLCLHPTMTTPDTQAPADGASVSSSEASRPAGAQDERVEVLQSGLSFRSGDCDGHETPVSNRFRSNIEIVEKPRQMVVLVATIVGASYLVSAGFTFHKRRDATSSHLCFLKN